MRCVVGGNERVFHTTIELKPIYKADNHVVFGQIGFEVGQVSFLGVEKVGGKYEKIGRTNIFI